MNKKRITSIVIAICILVCSAVVIYAKDIIPINETDDYTELSLDEEKIARRINQGKSLETRLMDKGHNSDYINISMDKYVETTIINEMTDEENQYIMSLFEKGYDFEKLIDIYTFLKNTCTEIYAIEEIYNIAKNFFDSPNWIENAYDKYIGDGRFEISTEEVFNYVKNGISPQEIMRCYEICLSTNRSLRDSLNDKLSGKSWDEIFFPQDTEICLSNETSVDDIAKVIKISKHINKRPEEIIEKTENGVKVHKKALKEFKNKKEKVKIAKEKFLKTKEKGVNNK